MAWRRSSRRITRRISTIHRCDRWWPDSHGRNTLVRSLWEQKSSGWTKGLQRLHGLHPEWCLRVLIHDFWHGRWDWSWYKMCYYIFRWRGTYVLLSLVRRWRYRRYVFSRTPWNQLVYEGRWWKRWLYVLIIRKAYRLPSHHRQR